MELGDKYASALLTAAEAKSEALRLERLAKRFYSACYLTATGTIAEREAKARTNEEYQRAEDEWVAAEHAANVAQAKADAIHVAYESWRTQEATKRAEMSLR